MQAHTQVRTCDGQPRRCPSWSAVREPPPGLAADGPPAGWHAPAPECPWPPPQSGNWGKHMVDMHPAQGAAHVSWVRQSTVVAQAFGGAHILHRGQHALTV
eukprot:1150346-Pelagomonas_calceolata.AAC.4